jgi:hypothetical protein
MLRNFNRPYHYVKFNILKVVYRSEPIKHAHKALLVERSFHSNFLSFGILLVLSVSAFFGSLAFGTPASGATTVKTPAFKSATGGTPANGSFANRSSLCQNIFLNFKPVQNPSMATRSLLPSLPSPQEVRHQVKIELNQFASDFVHQAASVLNNGQLTKEEKQNRIKQLGIQHPYLEPLIATYYMEEIAQNLVLSPQSHSSIKRGLSNFIIERRNRYYDIRRVSETGSEQPLDLENKSLFTHQEFAEIEVFKLNQLVRFEDLATLCPRIDSTWRRTFTPDKQPKPQVILFEMQDIPGTIVAVFNNLIYMNNVFNRASTYIETADGYVTGPRLFGMEAIGHDLKGPDLFNFWTVVDQAQRLETATQFKQQIPSSLPEYHRRTKLEQVFFQNIILPAIKERGSENVVFLGGTSGISLLGTLAHEAWHAKYFTNKKWRDAVRSYWANMSKADQDLFKYSIAHVGYNLNDMDLMANELQAYLLEIDDPVPGTSKMEIQIEKAKAKLLPPFLEFVRQFNENAGSI